MDLTQLLFLSALSLCSFSFLIKSLLRPKNKKRIAPMVPGAWPLIGHLRAFDNGQPTHVTFGNVADVYGPVFMTKLGSLNVLIISSQDVAKEIYTVHDKVLNRPVVTASKILGYNDTFLLFSPDRSYWREMRKIMVSEILSTSVVETLKYSRAKEVGVAFNEFYRKWEQNGEPQKGVLVDMRQEFNDLTSNMSLMMLAGKRYFGGNPNCDPEEAMRCRKLIHDFMEYFGLYLISDAVPCTGWLDWKVRKGMKKTANEFDKIVEAWIEEHKKRRKNVGGAIEKTFLDILIDSFEQRKNPDLYDAHTATKALCLGQTRFSERLGRAWLSGSEASVVALVWAVSLLVNNAHVLRKAQEELNSTIGEDRVVEESDLKDLVYLQAIVKETFRLYPPVPLTAYRIVTEDFEIVNGSFHVPAGTQLMVNAWKIQRDPSIWSNPDEFEPERFLTTNRDVDVGGQNYKMFPFGLGRKACPAIPLGMKMVQYILARFLHSFDVARQSIQDVDMTESSGMVNLKATPLEVFITPKLHKSIYHVDHMA